MPRKGCTREPIFKRNKSSLRRSTAASVQAHRRPRTNLNFAEPALPGASQSPYRCKTTQPTAISPPSLLLRLDWLPKWAHTSSGFHPHQSHLPKYLSWGSRAGRDWLLRNLCIAAASETTRNNVSSLRIQLYRLRTRFQKNACVHIGGTDTCARHPRQQMPATTDPCGKYHRATTNDVPLP